MKKNTTDSSSNNLNLSSALINDFGSSSSSLSEAIPNLYSLLIKNKTSIADKFLSWRQFYYIPESKLQTIYSSFLKHKNYKTILQSIVNKDNSGNIEIDLFIYAVHTYFSIIIKLLCLKFINRIYPNNTNHLSDLSTSSSNEVQKILTDMENGKHFKSYKITNLITENLFSWHISCWNEELSAILKSMTKKIDQYNWITEVDAESDELDPGKNFYQDILPVSVRHALGEYYTPDWLSEYVVNQSGYKGSINDKIIDISCGTGTFISIALRKKILKSKKTSASDIIKNCIETVYGIDINPAAVICSKMNYLFAIGKYLPESDTDITLPIFQWDSLFLFEEKHHKSINLKENYFNYVVGNPPWISWINLPQDYRSKIRKLMQEKYNLVSPNKASMKELGQVKKDISMLFVYVAMDKYLSDKGILAYVITQTLFQSQAAQEFRKFMLPEKKSFRIFRIDDMKKLSPFKATNKTVCMFAQKAALQTYPSDYIIWDKNNKRNLYNEPLKNVLNFTNQQKLKAFPENGSNGYWIISSSDKLIEKNNSQFFFSKARAGVSTSLESAFRVNITGYNSITGRYTVENNRQRAKIFVPEIKGEIEESLIYPYISGKSVSMFNAKIQGYYIIPHSPETAMKPYDEQYFSQTFPSAYQYFLKLKDYLLQRQLHKRWGKNQNFPFYSLYNIGKYSFAPYKLVWKRTTNNFEAAVISCTTMDSGNKRMIIPNNKVMMIPFDDPNEAHYYCAVINSSSVRQIINGAISSEAHKSILNHAGIIKYDPGNIKNHKKLSDLSKQAHVSVNSDDTQEIIQEMDNLLNQ